MKTKQITESKLITAGEYLKLDKPNFQGQTRPNSQDVYYMYWEDNGILYHTENSIYT